MRWCLCAYDQDVLYDRKGKGKRLFDHGIDRTASNPSHFFKPNHLSILLACFLSESSISETQQIPLPILHMRSTRHSPQPLPLINHIHLLSARPFPDRTMRKPIMSLLRTPGGTNTREISVRFVKDITISTVMYSSSGSVSGCGDVQSSWIPQTCFPSWKCILL